MLCSICCLRLCTLTIKHSWNVEMVPLWVHLYCPVVLICTSYTCTEFWFLLPSVWCSHQLVSWHNRCSKWLRNMAELLALSPPASMVVLPKGPRSVTWKEVWCFIVVDFCQFGGCRIFTQLFSFKVWRSVLPLQEGSSTSLKQERQISADALTLCWMRQTECWTWVLNHRSGKLSTKLEYVFNVVKCYGLKWEALSVWWGHTNFSFFSRTVKLWCGVPLGQKRFVSWPKIF